jgi:hypothetical protein
VTNKGASIRDTKGCNCNISRAIPTNQIEHSTGDYAEGLDFANPKDVTLPGPDDDPVPFLTTTNGLACEASGCNHLCATVKMY